MKQEPKPNRFDSRQLVIKLIDEPLGTTLLDMYLPSFPPTQVDSSIQSQAANVNIYAVSRGQSDDRVARRRFGLIGLS